MELKAVTPEGEQTRRVTYRVLSAGKPPRYGIRGDSADRCVAAAPFTGNRLAVQRMVAWLNQFQMPLEDFREWFLSGEM